MSSSKTSTIDLTLAKGNNLGIKIPKVSKSTYNSSSLFAAGMGLRSEETYQAQIKEKQKQIENLQKEINSFNDSSRFGASKETNPNPFSMDSVSFANTKANTKPMFNMAFSFATRTQKGS